MSRIAPSYHFNLVTCTTVYTRNVRTLFKTIGNIFFSIFPDIFAHLNAVFPVVNIVDFDLNSLGEKPLDFFGSGILFYLLSPYLCLISFLYLDL